MAFRKIIAQLSDLKKFSWGKNNNFKDKTSKIKAKAVNFQGPGQKVWPQAKAKA